MDLFLRFQTYLISELHRSPHTVDAYLRDAKKLLTLAGKQALPDITSQDIRSFIRQLSSQNISARSIGRILSAWRSWYNLLIRDVGFSHNPCTHIRPPKIQKKLPKTLSPDLVQHFLDSFPTDSLLAIRDKAMFELAYSSGLRVSELANLTLTGLALNEGHVMIKGKGNKTRVTPMGKAAQEAISAWLSIRPQKTQSFTDKVFTTQYGKKMSTRNIALRIKTWGIKLGINTSLYPHMMRHSCASHLLQSSQDLRAVQELLGHASIQTTQVYTHLDFQHLAKIYDQAHPRAKQKSTSS